MSQFPSDSNFNNPSPYASPQSPYEAKPQHHLTAKPHSGLGIASFIIALIAGAIFLAIIITIAMMVGQYAEDPNANDFQEVAPFLMISGLGLLGTVGLSVIGVVLAFISFFMKRKQLFAILGIVFNLGIIFLFAGLMLVGTVG